MDAARVDALSRSSAATTKRAIISITAVSKTFDSARGGRHLTLTDFSLDVAGGEFVSSSDRRAAASRRCSTSSAASSRRRPARCW
jgi:hypothetical protein